MDRVSIVIPCYNPTRFLFEAIGSARAQAGCAVELILVNDGTSAAGSRQVIQDARRLVDIYLEQPNRGLPAARNAGFRAAQFEFVIPLDSDDRLAPGYATSTHQALALHPEAAFAYCDYRVFGNENSVQLLRDYNLYDLLDRNVLPYAAMIRRLDWEQAGGYDESMRYGYEDWEFWLRLGGRQRFGCQVSQVLFEYRKHGPSLLDTARARHEELIAYIRQKHSGLYAQDGRAAIKRRWSPAVCIAAPESEVEPQTIRDWAAAGDHPHRAGCNTFLVPHPGRALRKDSAELAALAVWAGRPQLQLQDGSRALSREAFLEAAGDPLPTGAPPRSSLPGSLALVGRHLSNAGLLSREAWTRHPLRSASRLIPLRWKERANLWSGRQLFDLTFYLQFQPSSVEASGAIHQPLDYIAAASGRTPVAFVTPHLGPGGAEAMLLQAAASLDRNRHELFLFATQSQSSLWAQRWADAVDHVYDLRELVGVEKAGAAVYSIAVNWAIQTILLQNTAIGYSVLPQLKARLPLLRIADLIHSADRDWDITAATLKVEGSIDTRIAVSEAVRRRLLEHGIPDSKIRVVRGAVDLRRFALRPPPSAKDGVHRVLFAGRLDPVKRPLLLPEIAAELRRRRGKDDFRFVIAGDGPEEGALRAQARKCGVESLFDFRGQVEDIAPVLGECEMLILPSRAEGIPLVILEAFAARRPVVASAVGGIPEVVTPETGVAIPHGKREIQEFAEALDRFMEQPLLRETCGANGCKLVESSFDPERFAADYRSLLAR